MVVVHTCCHFLVNSEIITLSASAMRVTIRVVNFQWFRLVMLLYSPFPSLLCMVSSYMCVVFSLRTRSHSECRRRMSHTGPAGPHHCYSLHNHSLVMVHGRCH